MPHNSHYSGFDGGAGGASSGGGTAAPITFAKYNIAGYSIAQTTGTATFGRPYPTALTPVARQALNLSLIHI